MRKTLLLDASFSTISFIEFRRLIKLVVRNKIEILSNWDEEIHWESGKMFFPSVVRLYRFVPRIAKKMKFNRKGIFRRDSYLCMYCGIALSKSHITIDHVIPTSQGGENTWRNCVSCCFECNSKKGNRTPEQAGMPLILQPTEPTRSLTSEYILTKPKHNDWADYFPSVTIKQHIPHAPEITNPNEKEFS